MDTLRKQIDEYEHEKELMDEYAFAKAKVKDLTKFVSAKDMLSKVYAQWP